MHVGSPRTKKNSVGALFAPSNAVSFTAEAVTKDEHGFALEAETLSVKLADVKSPWMERMEALKRLQAIALGGAGSLANFKDVLNDKLRYPLVAQIGELRSQIVKEACVCIMALCSNTPPVVWDEVVAWFVPALQKQLPVTVLAISSAVNTALRFFIDNNRLSTHTVRFILEGCKFKSAKTRARSFEHLFLIVHRVDVERQFGHDIEQLFGAVSHGMGDTDPLVRQLARLTYWGLEKSTPRATALWARLSDSHRKLVSDERATYLTINLSNAPSAAAAAQAEHAAAAPPPPAASRRTATPSRGGVRSTSVSAGAAARVRTRSMSAIKPHRSVGPLTETRSANTLTERMPVRKASFAREKASRRMETDEGPDDFSRNGLGSTARDVSLVGQTSEPRMVEELLSSTSRHPDWEVRVDAFSKVAALAAAGSAKESVKVLEACLQRVHGDAHFKVTIEILQCVQTIIEAHPKDTLPCLEKVLAHVFGCMSDRKTGVKEAARGVVDTVMGANTVSTMVGALLKVLEGNPSKVRLSCLECLLYILRFCSEYLAPSKHMRQVVAKLVKVMKQCSEGPDGADIVHLGTSCLQLVSKMQPTVFTAEVVEMTTQQKKELLSFVADVMPDLQHTIMLHSESRNARPQYAAPAPERVLHAAPAQQPQNPVQARAAFDPAPQAHHDPAALHAQSQGWSAPHHPSAAPPAAAAAPTRDALELFSHGDSSDLKQQALRQLLQFPARQQQWRDHFVEIMQRVQSSLRDNDYATRSLAVSVIHTALEHLPDMCERMLPDIFQSLFRAVDDHQTDVSNKARDVLHSLPVANPHAVVETILQFVGRMSDRCLQVVLVGVLPSALAAIPLEHIMLDPLRALIHTAIQSDTTDLRKAATWCLVDLYIAAHATAVHLCAGLPPAKVRLLDFYISRRGAQASLALDLESLQ
eukprot:Rhum_TRINITY_DN11688_c1_g1::Rhum_TRINITY_DN11688_c1_g1_i1::g.46197::m.46197